KQCQYEPEKKESEFLNPSAAGGGKSKGETKGAEQPPSHAIEEQLPKMVVGLVGVRDQLAKPIEEAKTKTRNRSGKKTWKAGVRQKAIAEKNSLYTGPDKQGEYEDELAAWSEQWDTKDHKGYIRHNVGLYDDAPERPYDRSATEARVAK